MRVCHLTSVHPRHEGRILRKQCVSLAEAGYEVFLLVADARPDEEYKNVKILHVDHSAKSRLRRMIFTTKRMLARAIEIDADIYHIHDPELIPAGLKLKKRGKTVIFDSHEDVPAQIMCKEYIPRVFRGLISKIYATFEKYALKRMDALVSVTEHQTERLKRINQNTAEITNYPLLEAFERDTKQEGGAALCFAGGIIPSYNHDKIIRVLGKLKRARYLLAGADYNSGYIDKLKTLEGWEYVSYYGRIPFEEVLGIYREASAGVAVLNYVAEVGHKNGTGGNNKIYEFMMAGLPVICTDFVIWKDMIDRYECGICVDPNDEKQISDAIEYLLDNPEAARKMGENGRKAVLSEYNWNTQAVKLTELYARLSEGLV